MVHYFMAEGITLQTSLVRFTYQTALKIYVVNETKVLLCSLFNYIHNDLSVSQYDRGIDTYREEILQVLDRIIDPIRRNG